MCPPRRLEFPLKTEAGADQFGTMWKPLAIGSGGFITGIDIASDGMKVIRTDTYGVYTWNAPPNSFFDSLGLASVAAQRPA